jgi:hypothetical protein
MRFYTVWTARPVRHCGTRTALSVDGFFVAATTALHCATGCILRDTGLSYSSGNKNPFTWSHGARRNRAFGIG